MSDDLNQLSFKTASHVGVTVKDLDRSIAFYKALSGRSPVVVDTLDSREMAATAGWPTEREIRYATLRLENLNIDLIELPWGHVPAVDGLSQTGRIHFSFLVEDLDDARLRLQDLGVDLKGPPYVMEGISEDVDRPSRFLYFQGPDGEILELMEAHGRF